MGKKQSLGAVKQQKPGTGITRFLERRAEKAPSKEVGCSGADGRYVAVVRAPVGRASTPGKHLLDNVLLSQDADDGGMQVVWASSPAGAALSPQKGAAGSQELVSASQQQAENSQASKEGFRKTLIEAVQRAPSDAEVHLGAPQGLQPADDLLEQLLFRRSSHRAASTSAPRGEPQPGCVQLPREERTVAQRPGANLRGSAVGAAPGGSIPFLSGSDDLVMQGVLAGTDSAYETPAAARRHRGGAAAQIAESGRAAIYTPAALTLGGKRPVGASGGARAASGGNKRRALLDLLDQVELMVKHRGPGAADQPSQPKQDLLPRGGGGTEQAHRKQHKISPDAAAAGSTSALHGSDGSGSAARAGGHTAGPPGSGARPLGLDGIVPDPAPPSTGFAGAGHGGRGGGDAQGPGIRDVGGPEVGSDVIMPTQPLGDNCVVPAAHAAAAAVAAAIAATPDHAGIPAPGAPCASGTGGFCDHGIAMRPPAARLTSTAPTGVATPALQPLPSARVIATPYPALLPSGLAGHAHTTTGCPAATPQQATAGAPPSMMSTVVATAAAPPLQASTVARRMPSTGPCHGGRSPVIPKVTANDDDDDDFWGDVDVDALVANATSKQASSTGPGPAANRPAGASAAQLPPHPPPSLSLPDSQRVFPQQACMQAPSGPAVFSQQHHHPQQQGALPRPDSWQDGAVVAQSAACGAGTAGGGGESASASASAAIPLLGYREEVHFVVLEVEQLPNDHTKVLHCFNEYKGYAVRVCLRDTWADTEVAPGDTVNVVGGRRLPGSAAAVPALEVSDSEGLLVLHPDVLLSGTSVCTAIRCARQAWLQERVASGPGGEKALLGSMLHELLQRSLRAAIAGRLDKNVMMREARSILSSNTDKLLESSQQQDEASVLAHIAQQLDGIIAWCNTYVTPNPAAPQGGRIDPPTGDRGDAPTHCRVIEVLDIEESIWAPKYGLKGQLDASLRVRLSGNEPLRLSGVGQQLHPRQHWSQQQQPEPALYPGFRNRRVSEGTKQPTGGMAPRGDAVTGVIGVGWGQQQQAGGFGAGKPQHPLSTGKAAPGATRHPLFPGPPEAGGGNEFIVPFEFKTGKDWQEHKAQVLLYQLLMEDRYRTAVRTGLLWNSHKPNMQVVPYAHSELAALFVHRNRLAAHLVGAARKPPPPLQGAEADRKCEYCGVSATCALYLAASAHEDAAAVGAAADRAPGGCASSASAAASSGGGGVARLAELEVHRALGERLSTVSPSCAAFFAHWVRLVDLEEEAVRAGRAEVWALSGPQREQRGGCVAQLLLEREEPPSRQQQQQGDEEQRFVYVFRRSPDATARAGSAGAPGPSAAGRSGPAYAGDEEGGEGAGGLLCSGFAPGDAGLLGVEGRHAAAARVTVVAVTRDTLTLACRKELKYFKLGDTSGVCPDCRCGRGGRVAPAGGADQLLEAATCSCSGGSGGALPRVTWRLDRDEAASLFAQLRLNLSLLGVPGAGAGWPGGGRNCGEGSSYDAAQARREGILMQLRRLVIELEPPQQGLGQNSFSQMSASAAGGSGSSQLLHATHGSNAYLREAAATMNDEQLEAVQRVLAMQHYAILLGMPGTGKTTTIVHIIRALVESRTSILVAAYTNSAVDNILLKLVGSNVPFVRLGSAQAVHPAVRPYMPGAQRHPDASVAGLRDLMARVNVVGCTCLSVHNPLLAGRTFGVCILDEASQVTLPASIGALALARSFLLVGDHYQLSPLVVSREAAQGGLGVSLFRRLSEAHPQAVVTLRSQYRMAADIMALSNALVYNGRMLCGSDSIADAKLHLPYLSNLARCGSAQSPPTATPQATAWPRGTAVPGWLLAVLRPECRVVLLDTDVAAGCREVVLQDGMVNRGEAQLVFAVASALVAAGLPPRDIGVASPYKAQVAALQQALAGLSAAAGQQGQGRESAAPDCGGGDGGSGVEVLTVDKYQGRDKPAILLSLVRCNPSRSAGRLLADWQRLNVAITRARTKLVLLGSATTLSSIPLLEEMVRLLRRNSWVTQLPVDCLSGLPSLPLPASVTARSPSLSAGLGGADERRL